MQNYHARMLTVSVVPRFRPSSEEVLNFIKAGLACDSPVAFLNRHRGNQETIDSWHWGPIVRLDTDRSPAIADVYDEGIKKSFAPAEWAKETMLGGGFVYLQKTE